MHNDRCTTTTKLQSNNNSEQKDLDTFPFQFSRAHYMLKCTLSRGIWWPRVVLCQVSLTCTVRCKVSLTFTVRHTQIRCTPLVEASGGQEWYYIRSAWHLQSDIPRSDVPPSRGIWWPRVVLHHVIDMWLSFGSHCHEVRCVIQYIWFLELIRTFM